MSLPEHSCILICSVGDEWSTVSETDKNTYVTDNNAAIKDKVLLTSWLFNSKTITRRIQIGAFDETKTFKAAYQPLSDIIYAVDHPLPWNNVFGSTITNEFVSAGVNSIRWYADDGEVSDNSFCVFIFNGDWYWFMRPSGLFSISGQEATLSDDDVVVTGTVDFEPITITFHITERFY